MADIENKPSADFPDPQKNIPRWLQSYARHRQAGPFLLSHLIAVSFFILIFALSLLAGLFHRSGNPGSFWLCTFLLAVVMLALFVFSIPWWGGKWMKQWGEQLYAKDGRLALPPDPKTKPKWPGVIAGSLFAACILASVHAGKAGLFPEQYMQPLSAIYYIPFMIFIGFWKPAIKSPLLWLWPILYALHALMVLLNLPPIAWLPRHMDMFIATFGYGFFIAFLAYLWSRFSLYRLKKIVRQSSNTKINGSEPSHA